MQRLRDKIALVTGSTSGIGAGIARTYAAEGAQVVVTGRRPERGQNLVEELRASGAQAAFVQADLSLAEDCQRLFSEVEGAFGGLDILVNNTGIFPRCSFDETTPEFWDEMMAVNLRSAFLCSQQAARLMKPRGGGSIVNIGSGHAFNSGSGGNLIAYGVSKTAMYGMTMKLAGILAKDRIRVNWITVGWVLTEMEYEIQALEGRDKDELEEISARLPMGHNTVEDMAAGCLYLASDEAVRVTGSNINISAGMSIHI